MNTSTVVIVIVVFLAMDLVFYYLIIRSMSRPSPSIALARARDLSIIPDSEGESIGMRLRQRVPVPGGDLSDIVRLVLPVGEGYLFTTLPRAGSRLPRSPEYRRQFIAVIVETPADGALFIHPPVRLPFAGLKRRRLFRVFSTDGFSPVPADRLPRLISGRWCARVERERSDPGRFFTEEITNVLAFRAPRRPGVALMAGPGGLVIYINPSLTSGQEAGRFCDFARELVEAVAKGAR